MKAIEYYEKYKDAFNPTRPLTLNGIEVGIKELLFEFNDETIKICEDRHAKRNNAVISVLREQNQKWNALVRIFEKNYGISALKIDGFKNFWEHEMPELRKE